MITVPCGYTAERANAGKHSLYYLSRLDTAIEGRL